MNRRLYLILGMAFVLRVWGICFGPYHPDEPMVVNQALAFGAGNPFAFAYYYYPPFFHYIVFLGYSLFFVIGWVLGAFRDINNFLYLVLVKQLTFYVTGRLMSALMGTITVIPVYLIVKRIFSKGAGLLAALFMACAYIHVVESHYCTVDVPMTFMVMLSCVYIIRIAQNGTFKDYVLAGITAGLAMATKYSAAALIPCIMAASLIRLPDRKDRLKNIFGLILSWLCVLAAFLIICSYCIWDFTNFAKDANILYSATKYRNASLWYRFSVNLNYGLGLPLEILGALGIIYAIFKRRRAGLVLAVFPFLYLLMLVKAGQVYSRYVLPLVPFFAIGAGIIVQELIEKIISGFGYKKALSCFVVALIIIYPLTKSIYADCLFSRPDMRDIAKRWICENIPFGSRIAIYNAQYAPQLFQSKEQIGQKMKDLADRKGKGLKKKRLELLAGLKDYPEDNYSVYYIGKLLAEFSLHTPAISKDRKSILDNGIEYIITDDLDFYGNRYFYDNMKDSLALVYECSPFRDKNAAVYSKYRYSYMPMDDSLFDMRYNGVGIKIFKVQR